MVKSIQYFNDKSVPVFERLEDEFLRDPSDIALYIMKLTEELHKTGIRMIEETVQTSYRRGGEETGILDKVTKQTVMKKIHDLQFPPEDEVLKEKKVYGIHAMKFVSGYKEKTEDRASHS